VFVENFIYQGGVKMKKEIKHNCPTDMIFSDKKGKCINPNLEDE